MRLVVIALGATTLIQSVAAMAQLAVPVLATEIARDAGLPATSVGFYSAAVNLSAMLFQLVTGALVIRVGAIRIGQFGLCLAALGMLATFGLWLPALFLSAAAIGIGYGPATPAGSHILARVAPPAQRNLIFSIKQAGVPMGGVLAGLLLAPITEHVGWRTAMAVGAGLCLAVALAAQPARRLLDADRQPGHPIRLRAAGEAMATALREPALRAMAVAAFVYAAVQICIWSYLTVILVERVGFDLVTAGILYSAMQVTGVAARVLWGWVADRLLPAKPLLAGLGFAIALLLVVTAGLGPGWPVAAVATVAVGLGLTAAGWNGVFLAEVARLAPPGQVGTATGGVIFFTYGGVFLGPLTFGALASLTGGFVVPFLVSAALVAAAALFIVTRK